MGTAWISAGRFAALALLILAVSVTAIAIMDDSDGAAADKWIESDLVKYTVIEETNYLRVEGPVDTAKQTITSVEIREFITHDMTTYYPIEIAPEAFSGCVALQSVSMPYITVIGHHAFYECSSLRSVVTNSDHVSIYDYAFAKSGITTAEMMGQMDDICPHLFDECVNLESVKLYSGTKSIGSYAFNNCSSLKTIDIPLAESIGEKAFSGCISLYSITLPESLSELGGEAFLSCSSLKQISIPVNIAKIPRSLFDGCSSLENVTLNDGVTIIEPYAFRGCSSLSEITDGDFIRSIGSNSFFGCKRLTDLRLTTEIRYIGDKAFADCSGLRYVTLPNTVTSIGNKIFGDTVFYDTGGLPITDQSKLPGYSYEMKNDKMTRCNGCFYVVSYDVNGGSVPIDDRNENIGSSFIISEYPGVKEGMTCVGYECEGVEYMIGDMFVMPGHSVQMNMIWEKYVPPSDNKLISDETLKFIVWAIFSMVFGIVILFASMIIIHTRRN